MKKQSTFKFDGFEPEYTKTRKVTCNKKRAKIKRNEAILAISKKGALSCGYCKNDGWDQARMGGTI